MQERGSISQSKDGGGQCSGIVSNNKLKENALHKGFGHLVMLDLAAAVNRE